MTSMIRTIAAALFCSALASGLIAQVKPGTYANGSFDTKGLDTINLGNLNIMVAIPIVNKPGRGGTDFTYTLAYNGAVWYPASVSGVQTWVNTQNWGWQAQTEVQTGYVSYTFISEVCRTSHGNFPASDTSNVVYHDPFGGTHPFAGHYYDGFDNSYCPTVDTLSGRWSGDGKYQYGGTANSWILKDRHGNTINAPEFQSTPSGYVSASYIDTNGNKISVDGAGNFTDTMGIKVLSVSGTAPSPVTMSFTDAGGTQRSATIDYTSYTVRTEFGCSGINEASMSNVPLVSGITMADGSAYEFTYEATPAPGPAGAVTGRLASVTLPTGGTIQYAYTGANDGTVCSDGSGLNLTRTTTTDTGASVWTYDRVGIVSPYTTTNVTDGYGNQTTISFVEPSNGDPAEYYETGRRAYNGTIAGTPLLTYQTCYNNTAQSACGGSPLTLPINQIDTYFAPDNVTESGSTIKFNTYGLATERDTYDFGSTSARGSLLQKELWNYPGSGIVNLISSYQVYDASNSLSAQTSYTYDTGTLTTTSGLPQHVTVSGPRGNMTSITQYADGSHFVYNDPVYDDAGTVRQVSTYSGQTNFTGFDSTDTFATGTTLPATPSGIVLTLGAAYDSNTGAVTNTMDANGAQTIYSQFDSFSRPQTITYPDGGHEYLTYSPNQLIQAHDVDNSSARVQRYTQYDSYGRLSRIADENGQPSYDWYQTDYCYDANGRITFQPVRYQGGGWATAKRCSGAGDTTIYDGLGRVTRVTHADGSYMQYAYHGRATQITDENGVSRILQVDGLGRLTTVCELTSSGMNGDSPAACNLDIAGIGFSTQYTYSTNNTVTIYQGVQTRTLQKDWLGRIISFKESELYAPTTYTYTYNGTGLQIVRKRPKANQANPSVLTTTTSQYDALGRLWWTAYDDGTLTKYFNYDAPSAWSEASSQHNLKGRLSLADTSATSYNSPHTGTIFSYDPMGRVSNMWECEPSGCGNAAKDRALAFTYDFAGRQVTEGDSVAGTIQYAMSHAGEITSITNNTYNNSTNPGSLVSSVVNTVFGPSSYHLGNGLTNVMTYDSSGRSQYRWLCAGGVTTSYCNGGTQIYGFNTVWKGAYLTYSIDTAENTGGNYAYDQLGRVTSFVSNLGQATSYSWGYDRYGNRYSATPGANVSINKTINIIGMSGFANDTAGNMTADSVHSYQFDAENNLVTVDGGSTATYTYDAFNQRARIDNAQGSHEFTYDFAGRRVATWDANTNTGIQGQIWWNNMPLAYRDSDGTTYFQQPDWEGTQRILTNYAGSVSAVYTSRPWGEAYATTGKDDNISHYAGLEQSENTGILHAQYRDYDSSLGRWLSPDSYTRSYDFTNPQSFNRFTYAMNQASSAVDPSGLMSLPVPTPGGGGGDCWWCWDWGGFGGGPPPPQQPPVGPGKGGGNKDINKTWRRTVRCNRSAQQVMAAVQNDMGQFADDSQAVGFESSFPDQPIEMGNQYSIHPGVAFISPGTSPGSIISGVLSGGTLMVRVTSQSVNGWTFTTDPSQHYFDGTVSFSATDAGNGSITFSIAADANYVSVFTEYTAGPIIEAGENSNWNNMLNNIQNYCQSPIGN